MAGRASPGRYSARAWVIRLALAGSVAWIGYLSVVNSLAIALPHSELERAHALAPNNAQITARLSEALSVPEANSADRTRAADLARDALRRDATTVEAAATLGLDAAIRGDGPAAEDMFGYAQFLSRRNLATQLWAIEVAVERGDVAGALKHYDIALRTKTNAPELLYPVLVSAAADPNIRIELIKTLAAKPLWADSFVHYAARNSADPKSMAELFGGLKRANFEIPTAASKTLIDALLAGENYAEAWSYYSALRPGAKPQMSRDPDFGTMPETALAFDWVAKNTVGISTAIQPGAKSGIFDFAVSPSVSGVLLQQLQMLPQGDYVLEGRSLGLDQPSGSRPYWTLSCRRGGRELGRLEVANSSQDGGKFTGPFTVPADCPLQVLALVARSSNAMAGVTGQIDRAQLRPAR